VRVFPLMLLVAAVGCVVKENPGSAADSSAPAADKAAPADTTAAAPAPTPAAWTVSANAAGPVRVGMTADELRATAGDLTPPPNATAECVYVRPASAPPGVVVMLAKGVVARVDVDSAGVATAEGIAVGDTASKVGEAYAGRATATPHKYVPGGQYLTVKSGSAQDSVRIVFESEAGRITRYRVGRVPQVEWVERCG
jgi:hypothetical protein